MAVIKLSNPSLDRSVDAILARLSKLENQLKSGMISIASSAAQTAQVSVEKPSADTVNQTTQPVAAPEVAPTAPSVDIQALPSPSKKEVSIFEEWPQVLDALRHTNNASVSYTHLIGNPLEDQAGNSHGKQHQKDFPVDGRKDSCIHN